MSAAQRRWHDLTHSIRPNMPVYPGDPEVVITPTRSHAWDGYQLSTLQLSTHSGTHIDAPLHAIPGGRSLDAYPLEHLHGRALVLDIRHCAPDEAIDAVVLDTVRKQLDRVAMVLLCSGWDRFWGTPEYLRYPFVSLRLAQALVTAGIGLLGVDTASPDPLNSADLPAHTMLLGNDVLIVENLRGLDALAGQLVDVVIAPLNIADADGAPVRAMARPVAAVDMPP